MKYKILIVLAKFYEDLSKNLISGTKKKLKGKANIKIIEVPGSFEIPVVISKNIKKYDGFVALGSIIKGETPHFDFISQSTTDAIMQLSINCKKPIGNGIITTLNKKQAEFRSLTKGQEAAGAVLSVLDNF
jgi:6,7-dimethyl-8-ribityllumazine synthase